MLAGAGGETRARRSRRLSGILMAVLSGVLYGNNFTPPNYLIYHKIAGTNTTIGPPESMDYIFSHFTGIFATSTFWFLVYCCYMRGLPQLD